MKFHKQKDFNLFLKHTIFQIGAVFAKLLLVEIGCVAINFCLYL